VVLGVGISVVVVVTGPVVTGPAEIDPLDDNGDDDDGGSASVTFDEHADIASTETAATLASRSAARWTVISYFLRSGGTAAANSVPASRRCTIVG
jgi:hypothetical protein